MGKWKKRALVSSAVAGTMLVSVACGSSGGSTDNGAKETAGATKAPSAASAAPATATAQAPLNLTIAISQVGDIPAKGNVVEQTI